MLLPFKLRFKIRQVYEKTAKPLTSSTNAPAFVNETRYWFSVHRVASTYTICKKFSWLKGEKESWLLGSLILTDPCFLTSLPMQWNHVSFNVKRE